MSEVVAEAPLAVSLATSPLVRSRRLGDYLPRHALYAALLGVPAVVLAALLSLPFPAAQGPGFVVVGILAAPVVEEASKLAMVVWMGRRLGVQASAEGWLVLGACVGFGFALVETAGYALVFGATPAGMAYVGLSRMAFLPVHALTAGLAAYGYGTWKEGRGAGRFAAGVALAVLLHGVHNGFGFLLGGAV